MLQVLLYDNCTDCFCVECFLSFLAGRTLRLKVKHEYSDSIEGPSDVLQGSLLGPLLFNIKMRSLHKLIHYCTFSISSFVDDSNDRKSFDFKLQY